MTRGTERRFSREFKLAALARMEAGRTRAGFRASSRWRGSISTSGESGFGPAGRWRFAVGGVRPRRRSW